MADIYLNADSGNDTTGDGSSGTPYKTLSKGYSVAANDDTIYLQQATATYDISANTGSTSLTGLTVRGVNANTDDAVVKFTGAYDLQHKETTYLWLTFDGNSTNSNFEGPNAESSDITMTDCILKDFSVGDSALYYGLFKAGFGQSNTAVNRTLTRVLISNLQRLSGQTYGNLIGERNTDGSSAIITNCTIELGGTGATLLTHLFANNGAYTNSLIQIKNTIIYSPSSVNFYNGSAASTETYDYNDAYNIASPPSGTANITSDPLFVDAANDNYNLRPTSPCIDTGVLI